MNLHDDVYEACRNYVSGEKNVLYKMKDFWTNPVQLFTNYEKYAKKIRKAQRLKDYEKTVHALVREKELREELM